MREASTLSFLRSRKKHASKDEIWQAILKFLPHPALVVHQESERVLASNDYAVSLTGFTHAELDGLHLTSLFPQSFSLSQVRLASSINLTSEPPSHAPIIAALLRRDQTLLEVEIYLQSLLLDEEGCLLVLQPLDGTLRTPPAHPLAEGLYQKIGELMATLAMEDMHHALTQALHIAADLCQVDVLVYYQIDTQRPLLERTFSFGECNTFPETLPLGVFAQVGLWRRGERTHNELHRLARQAGWPFLCSIAIGQPQETIGLLVMAHTHIHPIINLEAIAGLVSWVIYALTQRHTLVSNLEAQLRESSLQTLALEAIALHNSEGLIWLSPEFHILKINPAAGSILGYAEGEIIHAHIEKVLVGNEDLHPILEEVLRHAQSTPPLEKRFFRRNGEEFLCKFQVIPITLGRQVAQILLRLCDQSEIEGLQVQSQRLEQQARLGQAMQIFSHEARNLLNPISMGLQLLQIHVSKEPALRETIDEALQDLDRLTELFNTVLETSRNTQFRMEAVNIPLLLKRMLERTKARFDRYKVTYELIVPDQCPPIRGDVRALEQVFSNLINNALQAMEQQGGKLGIKVNAVYPAHQKGYLEISFADTGPGIPAEMQEKIFHPFVTTKEKGTGLGLAISRLIITSHKGTIQLNSIPGATIFTVKIPIMETEH